MAEKLGAASRWKLERMLHDYGVPLSARDPASEREVDRRIALGVSGKPIFLMQPPHMEEPPAALREALAKRGIYFHPVPEGEYFLQSAMNEPDIDYLLNYRRGAAANMNGVQGEKRFRNWCERNGYLYLKTKFFAGLWGLHRKSGDRRFWKTFGECAGLLSKSVLRAIKAYMRIKGIGMYGEVLGMADFFVIHAKNHRRQFFVEVKSGSRLKLAAAQAAASEFFETRGIKTRVWRADTGRFDGSP